jgi:hypothetical protein
MNGTQSSFHVDSNNITEKVKELIREGNVRRLIVRRGDETIAEFPLTAAVVGTVLAPVLAAIGAIAALVTECTIEVERTDSDKTAGSN